MKAITLNYSRFCINRIRIYVSDFDFSSYYGSVSTVGVDPPFEDLHQNNIDLRNKVKFAFYRSKDVSIPNYADDPPENVKYQVWRQNLVHKHFIYCKPKKTIHIKNLTTEAFVILY